jgi:hypothetical protein
MRSPSFENLLERADGPIAGRRVARGPSRRSLRRFCNACSRQLCGSDWKLVDAEVKVKRVRESIVAARVSIEPGLE